eukprot:CAMPEP_0203989864 /NCGR_PEP_ID=MMETSP0360-20130528/8426_1 /ASSEMBLY_ACC=CAM_ASM_000342 /TAXON_ID=268821 /ORGANISM="Scrippsiella Hangoei, Strain SHTV-5" /LENGTH=754 /DNA_ID=CAMNT_0050929851 /DNA_START=106 /DNA_END=2366 /DNA_ORIENTATION=+
MPAEPLGVGGRHTAQGSGSTGGGGKTSGRRGGAAGASGSVIAGSGLGAGAVTPAAAGVRAGALPTSGIGAGGGSGSGAKGVGSTSGAAEEDGPRQRRELQVLSDTLGAAEREGGYPSALRAFEASGESLPAAQAWRAHLELAECAKRGAALPQVKYHLAQALLAQPCTVQVWLESCRTLDELGELEECRALLERGLECCSPNEQLSLKLVRVLERLGDHSALRSLAGLHRREPPERTSKVLLDAAHFEVRSGNGDSVREFLRCLVQRLPHQGPIYCEACRIESILGNWQTALMIAEIGVQTCLRYGPLWFVLLRQAEKAYGAKAVKEYASHALRNICHELHWKVHFEVAAAFGRARNLHESRRSIELAVLSCPKHLRWKVWLLAARSELWDGSPVASRKLLAQAKADAPARVQVAVCVERARAEEFLSNLQEARNALDEARSCEGHDWKVFLEHIFMEARHGFIETARDAALNALDMHPATGRLWSALIALEHSGEGGAGAAMTTFRKATREVPKSGEVWCEGARVFMNPLGPYFHLGRAHKCLEFAVHLTPQYGDSFLELFRLRFLLELRTRIIADPLALGLLGQCTPSASSQNTAMDQCVGANAEDPSNEGHRRAIAAIVTQRVCSRMSKELKGSHFAFSIPGFGRSEVLADSAEPLLLEKLEVLCAYADPNYGFLWFWCRESSLSTPLEVLVRMREEVAQDLVSGGALWAYAWAVSCSVFGLCPDDRVVAQSTGGGASSSGSSVGGSAGGG